MELWSSKACPGGFNFNAISSAAADGRFALLQGNNPKGAHQGLAAKWHGLQFLAEKAHTTFRSDRDANASPEDRAWS